MKKVGFIVFVIAIVIGVAIANLFSWGKATGKVFDFSVNVGAEKGSGNTAVETRNVPSFSKVDVSSVFEVLITAQKDFAVEVEADDNLLQHIRTEVKGGQLEISLDRRVKTANPLRVRISAPNIERIEASGASRVELNDLKNSALSVDTSGASKVKIAGETANLIVEVSGASHIEAQDLTAQTANVEASGASRVSLSVLNELISDASGASRIIYTGEPKVTKSTSGASSITQR